jgi:hypothetical protein
MNVLLTLAVIVALAAWLSAVYTRLSRLRDLVKQAWSRLEADTSNAAVRTIYNKHVEQYNAALDSFPANIVGPSSGFKPARRFES